MIWFSWLTVAMAADLTFVVVGDTQGAGTDASINVETLPQLVEDINAHEPALTLFPGGLVAGSDTLDTHILQWDDFKSATADLSGELMLLPGTSDVTPGEGSLDAWRTQFDSLPIDDSPAGEEGVSYYRDFGSVRLISIASDQETENQYSVSEAGLVWLERVLEESADFDHVFVMTHHPVSFSAYPSESVAPGGGLGHTGSTFWQTLVRHEVTALFAGHWNRYQAAQLGNGGATWEFIVGTGGGMQNTAEVRAYQERVGYLLVEVTGGEVTSTFYGDEDEDGHYDNPLHTLTLATEAETETGLVARYTFDDGSAADSSPESTGFGIDGVLANGIEVIDEGAVGAAVQVQGDDEYVEVGTLYGHQLSLLNDVSVSMWVKIPSLNSGDWDNVLLAYASEDLSYTQDEQSNYAYFLNVLADGRLQMFWEYENGKNVSVVSSSPTSVADGEWHHIGFVRDSTRKRVDFYADGEPLGFSGTYVRPPTGASRGMLYLGADIAGSNDSGSGAGEWFWSDGSEVTFTAWAVGEPNDYGGNQDCGVMHWGGSVEQDWDDLGCDESRAFICQGTEVSSASGDTGLEPSEVECEETEYEGSMTLFCTTPLTWLNAREECRARGLDLVSIHSEEEQAWLYAQGEEISASSSWYIGLRESESVSSVDEVCIYNQMLDAGEMGRLGEMEDCITVLEPLPPEPEDTGLSDTGLPDSGTAPGDVDEELIDSGGGFDEDTAASATGGKAGCGCASSNHYRGNWFIFVLLTALLGRRRFRGASAS